VLAQSDLHELYLDLTPGEGTDSSQADHISQVIHQLYLMFTSHYQTVESSFISGRMRWGGYRQDQKCMQNYSIENIKGKAIERENYY
jgi:hypothetical protein